MSPRCAPRPAIQSVLKEFLEERSRNQSPVDSRLYRHVVFFLELCINQYGHRNLGEEERAWFEVLRGRSEGGGKDFYEIFGPELLVPELDFFLDTFLKRDVLISDRATRRAGEVVSELSLWLVRRGYVSPAELQACRERSERRAKLKVRLRRLTRALSRRTVLVDPSSLGESDYVALDDHVIGRVEPGRLWLRVHRSESPEEIGPIVLPVELTAKLRRGWNLCCALGRLRGRWQLVELEEIHPSG